MKSDVWSTSIGIRFTTFKLATAPIHFQIPTGSNECGHTPRKLRRWKTLQITIIITKIVPHDYFYCVERTIKRKYCMSGVLIVLFFATIDYLWTKIPHYTNSWKIEIEIKAQFKGIWLCSVIEFLSLNHALTKWRQ